MTTNKREYMRLYMRKYNKTNRSKIANSAHWKGRKYELIAKRLLGAEDANKDNMCNPGYDLVLGDKTIDVKACNKVTEKNRKGYGYKRFWQFKRVRENTSADILMLFCLVNNIPKKVYMIPVEEVHCNHISIHNKSIWDTYLYKVFY